MSCRAGEIHPQGQHSVWYRRMAFNTPSGRRRHRTVHHANAQAVNAFNPRQFRRQLEQQFVAKLITAEGSGLSKGGTVVFPRCSPNALAKYPLAA